MNSILNREARSQYEFLQSWEAGLVLNGAEVKAVKAGMMNLKGSFVGFENGELWLKNAHIAPYQRTNQNGYNPDRPRKILLQKREIDAIIGKLHQEGLTIVPEKVYSNAGLLKIKISLARGLKKHDKRAKIKKRDIDRDVARALKQHF